MTAAAALSLLRSRWHIPLLAEPVPTASALLAPADEIGLLEALLPILDARVSMAVALWLSLLDGIPPLPPAWPQADKRRVAYLADVARALRLQRGEGEPAWSAEGASGLRPGDWPDRLPLFASVAPVLPASRLGLRWGISEVVDAADFAGFQKLFLETRARQEAS